MTSAAQIKKQIEEAQKKLVNGDRTEAYLLYETVADQAGEDAELHGGMGQFCLNMKLYDQAIKHFRKALHEYPENPDYLGFLGVALEQFGNLDEAREVLERATAHDHMMPAALHSLGLLYMRHLQYESAREVLERAYSQKKSDPGINTNLAVVLSQINQHEQALIHAKEAVKARNAGEIAYLVLGRVLSQLGRNDEATEYFQQAIRQHKHFGMAYYMLSQVRKFSSEDQSFIAKTEKMLNQSMEPHERMGFHFALGKMYEDCKEYERAFRHYSKGNVFKKMPTPEVKPHKVQAGNVRKFFNKRRLNKYRQLGSSSRQPVFVVGMPRSGTTLIEQMIASHPRAAGAGELMAMPNIADELFSQNRNWRSSSRVAKMLTPEKMAEYSQRYLATLQQGRHDADRIVDKVPGNFMFLGLIDSLFPHATIIHASRHPLDVSLSCYFQAFEQLHWSNELLEIAEMYGVYRRMMAYWHKVLPPGRIVDVHYENLVNDPVKEGTRLLNSAGLEWDDNVLQFHKQETAVTTASWAQVRQPIYKSSSGRWMRYAPWLGELAEALDPWLPEDRQELIDAGIPLPRRRVLARWLGRS